MNSVKKEKTTIRTEAIAGITTFFTMAYIIVVNPAILSTEGTGMSFSGVPTAMFRIVTEIEFRRIEEALPAFLTIILIPLTFSIMQGILWGFITHVALFLMAGRPEGDSSRDVRAGARCGRPSSFRARKIFIITPGRCKVGEQRAREYETMHAARLRSYDLKHLRAR